MSKHEYRCKYRGYTVCLDKEQGTYWYQGGGGFQSLTKCLKAIDAFKGPIEVMPYTGGDPGVHWMN